MIDEHIQVLFIAGEKILGTILQLFENGVLRTYVFLRFHIDSGKNKKYVLDHLENKIYCGKIYITSCTDALQRIGFSMEHTQKLTNI